MSFRMLNPDAPEPEPSPFGASQPGSSSFGSADPSQRTAIETSAACAFGSAKHAESQISMEKRDHGPIDHAPVAAFSEPIPMAPAQVLSQLEPVALEPIGPSRELMQRAAELELFLTHTRERIESLTQQLTSCHSADAEPVTDASDDEGLTEVDETPVIADSESFVDDELAFLDDDKSEPEVNGPEQVEIEVRDTDDVDDNDPAQRLQAIKMRLANQMKNA